MILGELGHHVLVDGLSEGFELFFGHLADIFGHLVVVALCHVGVPFDFG
jgi:hypothetical protein